MKKTLLFGLVLLGTILTGRATIYYQGTAVSGGTDLGSVANPTIVDGNPTIVTANSMTLSGLDSSVASITVTLNLSGGCNNGLYGYLVGPGGGTTVILLNQPGYGVDGFGALGSGLNITLGTSGSSIQSETSGSALTGNYQPAGNLLDFTGINPNGTWTLYFADTIAGGGNATLNGWSLNITAVPEPVNVALAVFGMVVIGAGVVRQRRAKSS